MATDYLENEIPFVVETQTSLGVGRGEKDLSKSGCHVIQLRFNSFDGVKLTRFSFKNYYSAYISIRCKVVNESDTSQASQWISALTRFKLMPNPHCEKGSQSKFDITLDDYDLPHCSSVRLVLQQPSSVWSSFKIQDIHCYQKIDGCSNLVAPQHPPQKPLDRKKILPLESADEKLSKMLTLMKDVSGEEKQMQQDGYDFEVNGTYDINLLSYT